jgi:hypothetical protein
MLTRIVLVTAELSARNLADAEACRSWGSQSQGCTVFTQALVLDTAHREDSFRVKSPNVVIVCQASSQNAGKYRRAALAKFLVSSG